MIADLHTHTTASDGQYAPRELVRLAKARGLDLLAVTDHDTIAGVEEAQSAGEALGLRVLRGVELSAREHHNFHLLGYGIQARESALSQLCEKLRASRDQRKYQIVDYLRKRGVNVDLAEVEALAGGEVIGKPHFAQVLVKHGYAATNREAFDRWLGTPDFRREVRRYKADARTCLDAIHDSGGKASLAHPYQMGLSGEELDVLVRQLAGWGLDAIECFYPQYTPEQREFYLGLTEKYHLHRTGGSDFHGERVKPDIQLAALDLDAAWLWMD